MSIPRLTKETVTTSGSTRTFSYEGNFPLHPISCTVTEERNGEYELEMDIPRTDKYFSEIAIGKIIRVPHDSTGEQQMFEIYNIENGLDGIAHVSAWHITYRTRATLLEPFSISNATANAVFIALQSHYIGDFTTRYPFGLYANVSGTVNVFEIKAPKTLREVLKMAQETFGGEMSLDSMYISLLESKGTDSGVVLQYGRNITSLKREQAGDNVFSAVYPFWKGKDSGGNEKTVTLSEQIVTRSYLNGYFGTYKIVIPLDLSEHFSSEPSLSSLRTAAGDWLDRNAPQTLPENIDLSVLQMDENGRSAVAKLNVCDTLRISYPDMGINVKAKVTKTIFNVLLDRYDSISIGTMPNTMNNAIKKVVGIK